MMSPRITLHFGTLSALTLLVACSVGTDPKDDVGQLPALLTPKPPACQELDETTCKAQDRCAPQYAVCAQVCLADGTCPPCPPTFMGCEEKPSPGPCETLGEAQCAQNPACEPQYGELCSVCSPGQDCGPHCETTFMGCAPRAPKDPCQGLPEALCLAPFCQPHYSDVCPMSACAKGSDAGCSDTCVPSYAGCSSGLRTCASNCDCAVNEYCQAAPRAEPSCPPCPAGVACSPCPAPLPAPLMGTCVAAPGSDSGGGGAVDGGSAGGGAP